MLRRCFSYDSPRCSIMLFKEPQVYRSPLLLNTCVWATAQVTGVVLSNFLRVLSKFYCSCAYNDLYCKAVKGNSFRSVVPPTAHLVTATGSSWNHECALGRTLHGKLDFVLSNLLRTFSTIQNSYARFDLYSLPCLATL